MGQSTTMPIAISSNTGINNTSNYSRHVSNRENYMYSYDFIKSKALFDARPRSNIYMKNRNKDNWSKPYDPFRTLGDERVRANRKAIVAKSTVLSNSLVNPHPYILKLPDSQKRLQRGRNPTNIPTGTVNAVPESRFDPTKQGSRAWTTTNVSPNGLS